MRLDGLAGFTSEVGATNEDMQAIVMAGGRGTRLHPYTAVLPKPLLPVGTQPVLELLLKQLRQQGFRSVVLAVNHLHHLIRAFFGDGSDLGIRIEYSVEDAPLGTCGPISCVLDRMAPNFLVLNGDLLTDLDLAHLLEEHRQTGAAATIAAARRREQLEYGALRVDAEGRLVDLREKPVSEWLVSMGVYALRRDAVRTLLPAVPMALDMPDLLLRLKTAGELVMVRSTDGLWLDIGRPDDFARAQALAEAGSFDREGEQA